MAEDNTKTSKTAVAALLLALLAMAIVFSIRRLEDMDYFGDAWKCLAGSTSIVGWTAVGLATGTIILGFFARFTIRRNQLRGRPIAVASILLGFLAFPCLLCEQRQMPYDLYGYDSAAAASTRTLYRATQTFAHDHPEQGFAPALSTLGESGYYVDRVLASGVKDCYRFTYVARNTHGDGLYDAVEIHADPARCNRSSRHHFFVDETGIVRYSNSGPANASSTAL
jgi:hypothetical protein